MDDLSRRLPARRSPDCALAANRGFDGPHRGISIGQ